MKNKIFKEEKSFKEDIEKLKSEKEDLIRQLSKTQTKETKWKYEIKKKEIELSDIKNKNEEIKITEEVDPVVEEFIQYFIEYQQDYVPQTKIKPVISEEWIKSIS